MLDSNLILTMNKEFFKNGKRKRLWKDTEMGIALFKLLIHGEIMMKF